MTIGKDLTVRWIVMKFLQNEYTYKMNCFQA